MNQSFAYFGSGVARRRKVGGHKLFSGKSEKQKKKKKKKEDAAAKKRKGYCGWGGGLIMLFSFIKLLGLCAICIKIVLKEGSGGPPPENFYRIRYKIRQF